MKTKIVELVESLTPGETYSKNFLEIKGFFSNARINRLLEFGLMVQVSNEKYARTKRTLIQKLENDLNKSVPMKSDQRFEFYKEIGLHNLNYYLNDNTDVESAISCLKQHGYRIQKPVTEWEEI